MKTDEEVIDNGELEDLEGGVSAEMEQSSNPIQGINRCCLISKLEQNEGWD